MLLNSLLTSCPISACVGEGYLEVMAAIKSEVFKVPVTLGFKSEHSTEAALVVLLDYLDPLIGGGYVSDSDFLVLSAILDIVDK